GSDPEVVELAIKISRRVTSRTRRAVLCGCGQAVGEPLEGFSRCQPAATHANGLQADAAQAAAEPPDERRDVSRLPTPSWWDQLGRIGQRQELFRGDVDHAIPRLGW